MRRGVLVGIRGLTIATFVVGGNALAQVVTKWVKPGDTGQIILPLSVKPDSVDDLIGATLTVLAPPTFTAGAASRVDISSATGPGFLNLAYSIVAGGEDGPLAAIVTPAAQNDLSVETIDPALSSLSYTANFMYDPTPPQVRVFDGESEVASNVDQPPFNTTEGQGLDVLVTDLASKNSGLTYGSGPARLEVWLIKADQTQIMLGSNAVPFTGFHRYTEFDDGLDVLGFLPVGHIQIRAFDLAGNESDVDFTIPVTAPTVTVYDPLGRFSYLAFKGIGSGAPPTTLAPGEVLHIKTPYGTSFTQITLTKNGNDISSQLPVWTSATNVVDAAVGDSGPDDNDTYVIDAKNDQGAEVLFRWRHVVLYIKGVDLTKAFSVYNGDGTFTATLPLKVVSSEGAVVTPNPVVTKNGYTPQNNSPAQTVVATDSTGNQVTSSGFAGSAYSVGATNGFSGGVGFTLKPDASGAASYDSPPLDSGLLPGAILFEGPYNSLVDGKAAFGQYVSTGVVLCPGTMTASINTGSACTLFTDNITCDSGGSAVHSLQFNPICTLTTSTYSIHVDLKLTGYTPPAPGNGPTPRDDTQFLAFGGPLWGVRTSNFIDPAENRYDPGQSTATLNAGISLSGLDLSTSAVLTASVVAQPPTGGYVDVTPGLGYTITATPFFGGSVSSLLNSPVTVRVQYSTTSLALPSAEAAIKILNYGSGGLPILVTPTSIDTVDHALTFVLPQFGPFKLVVPSFTNPAARVSGEFSITTDQNVAVGNPAADPRYAQFLNVLASTGIVPVSNRTWTLLTASTTFSPPARVTLAYTSAELASSAASSTTVFLGQYALESAAAIPLFSVQSDTTVNQDFSALLSVVPGTPVIAAFGRASPITARDMLPPLTTLLVGNLALPPGGSAAIVSTVSITLSAVDPAYAGAPTSGVAGTFYLVDQPFISTAATPGQPYAGAFTVSPGTHVFVYYSRDNAGNVEAAGGATVYAASPAARTVGGLGLGIDTSSLLWSVAVDGNNVALAHNALNGVFTASAALAGADASFPWSVVFDANGNPYAIGSAVASNGADQVAVYRPSAAGDAILGSRLFDSGFNNNNLVFGAVAPGWIVGAVQTAGPIDNQQDGQRSYSMALWKLDTSQGLLQLTTTYSRAGMDVGTGVSVDGAGNIWLSGYSSSPNPRMGNPLDLAVWKYAPDGKTLLAGPFFREGYLGDFNSQYTARIFVSSGTAYVAAPRARSQGGTDTAFLSFDVGTGRLLTENAWRSADAASTYVAALLQDPAGQLVAAGSFDDGATLAGVWRYGADGMLHSASQTDAGGAQGAVFNGSGLWLIVDGSSSPYYDGVESLAAGALADVLPPRTSLVAGLPSSTGNGLFVTSATALSLSVVDDKIAVGDGQGVGSTRTYYAVDAAAFSAYSGPFQLVVEGTHTVGYYSVDLDGHFENASSTTVGVDLTAPTAVLVAVGSGTFTINAQDPVVNGAASGVAAVKYLVDVAVNSCQNTVQSSTAAPGTCSNSNYAGAFTLSPGTHTVYFQAVDNVGNGANVVNSSYVVVGGGGNAGMANYVLNPTTGPIGIPFAFTGPGGFGSYQGANTRVLFGGAAAPLSVWNDTTIDGTVPGLSTGTYAVSVVIGTNTYPAGGFTVLYPTATAISVSSGPIGAPFVISGAQFGPYAGGLTRVLIGGATAPLSVWNDNTVAGTIPALSTGVYTVQVQRATGDGGVMSLSPFSMTVVGFNPTGFSPSSGPIGVPFTVTGSGFGPYAGNLTQFLFDGKPAPLSVWNDAQISGSVPNLSSGTHAVWISRQSSDGGLVVSGTTYFTVTLPVISTVAPTTGPIGNGFLITGRSFGAYGGSSTQVLFGGATTPLSVWNDTRIAGSVPGSLLPGLYPLYVERLTSDGGLVASNTVYFTVTAPFGASLSVSSGPIGVPFTITGTGFGSYAGANTVVLIGGKPAPLSVWNDTTISGSIPNLSTGAYGVLVERLSGNSVSSAAVGGFTVVGLNPQGLNPLSGPIGAPFTLTGSAFGPYAGGLTRVLFDGTAAALSVWNDAQIAGAVPALSTGPHALWIERASSDGGLMSSGTVYFTVVAPSPTGLTPTAGPIGSPFTITGSGFGPYGGANTRVMIGGLAAPLSVWNDTTISGNVPALSSGPAALWIERQAGSSVQSSGTTYFNVTLPAVASFSPSSAPVGAPFTFLGSGFGPYRGSNTQVLFNGTPAPLSVWNDGQVSGSVPGGLTAGPYGVVLQITAPGGSVQAATQTFTVLTPTIQAMSPTYGLAGTGVQLTGFGFGPYGGAQTQVLLGTTSVPLSVWNDGRIVWTVPSGVPNGTYPVVVSRTPSGGGVQSASMTFTVGATAGVALFAAAAPALAAQPDWHFEGALFLSTDTGGRIQSPSNAAVSVPPTALSSGTVVTMARDKTSYSASRAAAAGADKLGAGGEAVSFGPEGTRFNVPVTIELPYDPALVPVDKLGELAVHYYDPGAKTWTPLVSSVDPVRHVVSAQTTHFSLYQPLGHGIGVTAADASFGLKAAYAFPNPVHSGAVTIRIQPGVADSVSVRIYDVSGRKVHESSDFALNQLDDGNGLGAQYTYDHLWDVSGVGSGVYTFVITAKKAGQADLHKTGRVGVSK